MTAMAAEVNLSELLNKPRQTLELLDSNRELRLRRRDAEDLVLTTAERSRQDKETVRTVSALFQEMMREGPMVMAMAVQVLPAVFPWVRHLPDEERKEFAAEWLNELKAAASTGNSAALNGFVAGWRTTAEVYGDPELFAILTKPLDDDADYGPAIPPEVPE